MDKLTDEQKELVKRLEDIYKESIFDGAVSQNNETLITKLRQQLGLGETDE